MRFVDELCVKLSNLNPKPNVNNNDLDLKIKRELTGTRGSVFNLISTETNELILFNSILVAEGILDDIPINLILNNIFDNNSTGILLDDIPLDLILNNIFDNNSSILDF
jgi:hypothetical protein